MKKRGCQIWAITVLSIGIVCSNFAKGIDTLTINKIEIIKSQRVLLVYHDSILIKSFKVALGRSPVGKKIKEGDKKTPEGIYIIDRINFKSRFHKSLHISYPNKDDSCNARKLNVAPGDNIMIHGLPGYFHWVGKYHRTFDWTSGCIALTDPEIDEIIALNPLNAVVVIRP
jgi:murein L,D-transpeptidase YafK